MSEIDVRKLRPQLQLRRAKARRDCERGCTRERRNTMRRNRVYASG